MNPSITFFAIVAYLLPSVASNILFLLLMLILPIDSLDNFTWSAIFSQADSECRYSQQTSVSAKSATFETARPGHVLDARRSILMNESIPFSHYLLFRLYHLLAEILLNGYLVSFLCFLCSHKICKRIQQMRTPNASFFCFALFYFCLHKHLPECSIVWRRCCHIRHHTSIRGRGVSLGTILIKAADRYWTLGTQASHAHTLAHEAYILRSFGSITTKHPWFLAPSLCWQSKWK